MLALSYYYYLTALLSLPGSLHSLFNVKKNYTRIVFPLSSHTITTPLTFLTPDMWGFSHIKMSSATLAWSYNATQL